MRCPTADTLRLAWYGAALPDEQRERHAALTEHVKACPTCREIARRDTEQAAGATMPAMEQEKP